MPTRLVLYLFTLLVLGSCATDGPAPLVSDPINSPAGSEVARPGPLQAGLVGH